MVRLNELGRRIPKLWMDLFYVDPVLEADGCIWSDPVPDAPRLRIICVGSPDPKDAQTIRLWDGRSLAVGTHLWIDTAGGLLTDKQETVAKLDPETLKGALAAQKLAQELKEVADCTETYALRKLPLPDDLRMFTDQPAAVGLMYAALEANRLRQCQASGQIKGQSALSWLMLLGKLNPASKGTRAGADFSSGPKGKEQEAEHGPPHASISPSPHIKIREDKAPHIFRDAEGHLSQDTLANRQLLEAVANEKANYMGRDTFGRDWYTAVLADGSQAWVAVVKEEIRNGGVNKVPWTNWSAQAGLSK